MTAALVPIIGLWGAAIATLSAYVFLCLVRFLDLRKSPFALSAPRRYTLLGVSSFVFACGSYYLFPSWTGLLVGAAAAVFLLGSLRRWNRPHPSQPGHGR